MKNIVIFGGAFDPIHFGHINMAIAASKSLDADVYFVPARISVWKSEATNVDDRINMINLAIKSANMESRLKVSRIEADSSLDINYTIETIRQFKCAFPQDKLYLLIGTDQVNSFDKWKNAEEISQLANIIYFERGGLDLNKKLISQFKMNKIDGEISDASSTKIRDLISLDTPYEVLDYILSKNMYFVNKVKAYLTPQRFDHSVSVAKLSYQIAECNKLNNAGDYMIAGLLHDIGKNLSFDQQLEIMNKYYPEYIYLNRKIYHQFTGAYLAKHDFGIKKETIYNSIMFHTTGRDGMSDMEKVVYCADKIDPLRGFDSKNLIKAIKVNLDKGFLTILKANREYFRDNNVDFSNKLTENCMNRYLK